MPIEIISPGWQWDAWGKGGVENFALLLLKLYLFCGFSPQSCPSGSCPATKPGRPQSNHYNSFEALIAAMSCGFWLADQLGSQTHCSHPSLTLPSQSSTMLHGATREFCSMACRRCEVPFCDFSLKQSCNHSIAFGGFGRLLLVYVPYLLGRA